MDMSNWRAVAPPRVVPLRSVVQTELGMKWRPSTGTPGAGDGADGRLVVLDLLVAAVEAHHGFVVEWCGDVLDGFELEAGGLDLFEPAPEHPPVPPVIARQRRIVHLQAAGADLRGKAQALLGQLVKLATATLIPIVLVPVCEVAPPPRRYRFRLSLDAAFGHAGDHEALCHKIQHHQGHG